MFYAEGSENISTLPVKSGHFVMESGLHADLWIDLDVLFINPSKLTTQIDALADLILPYKASAVCGPLLGGAFVAQAVATRLGLRFYVVQQAPPATGGELYQAQYRLPTGLRSHATHERFAIVDDVISAGSSVRAASTELLDLGAKVAVVGALLCLGTRAKEHFLALGVPVVSPISRECSMWEPANCPLCRAEVPIMRSQNA